MKKQILAMVLLVSVVLALSGPAYAAGSSMYDAEGIFFESTYSGTISQADSSDYYAFTIPASGRIGLSAAAEMEQINYCIYDAEGQQVWKINPRWNITSRRIATSEKIDLTGGTYYFAVEKSGSSEGDYSFTLTYASADESFDETGNGTDNAMSSAVFISLDQSYQGQLAANDDRDFYQFALPSSGRVSLRATAGMEWVYYTLYDEVGRQLRQINPHWNSVSGVSTVDEPLDLVQGTYYLAVSQCRGATGNYSFTVRFASAEESFEENQANQDNGMDAANPVSWNELYRGQLALNDEKDFYEFSIFENGRVRLEAVAEMNWISYYIYDEAGTQLWRQTPAWNSATKQIVTDEMIDLEDGTYYLAVSRSGSCTGNYRFQLSAGSVGTKPVRGVALEPQAVTLVPGEYRDLLVQITPADAANRKVAWTSSDAAVARVDDTGRVSAVRPGTAVITVTTADGGHTASCHVTVANQGIKVTGVTLSRSMLSITAGAHAVLTATVTPIGASNRSVIWTSSDPSVALVNGNGQITAVFPGRTVITAETVDGGFTAQCTVIVQENGAEEGIHFPRVNVYHQDQFTDVRANEWYTPFVASAFEMGLMEGTSSSTFNPDGNVKVSEVIKLAAVIHSIYTTGSKYFAVSNPWYQVYLDYAYEQGIIDSAYYNSDVNRPATRAQFAEILGSALPDEALMPINAVPDNAIPDVKMSAPYAGSVYKLYRAGVLIGSNANGVFYPDSYIKRSETATIVSRMAESENRERITGLG